MRSGAALTVTVVAALLAAAAARRAETDFEFDDDAAQASQTRGVDAAAPARRPRRYVYDPHNPLCEALTCGGAGGAHATCVLRDAFTALCADRQEILRRGDIIVAGGSGAWGGGGGGGGREDDDDVFYEAGDRDALAAAAAPAPAPRDLPAQQDVQKPDRCVGCSPASGGGRGAAARSSFVCGSDNRTYSSLCRLDLHNCVRRPHPPVAPACPGFCPCGSAGAPAPPPRARRQRARARGLRERLAPAPPPRRQHDEYDDDDIATEAPAFPKEWWRRQAESEHNEVLPDRDRDRDLKRDRVRARDRAHDRDEHNKRRRLNKVWAAEAGAGAGAEAGACSLAQLADRLVDWFSVLMERAGATAPSPRGFPPACKPEVRWMFAHLDTGADGRLDTNDLYALRHDEREQCLRPFLASCAGGAGGAGGVTRAAWCGCLGRAARPCTALARAHPAPRPGSYVPACDARGFYRPRQCHPALGVCWCVTPHGVERPGTRTKGAPACTAAAAGRDSNSSARVGEGGAPADDEDADGGAGAGDGSGDEELPF